MNKYEAMYIVTPEMEDEAIKGVIEKFSGIITANGGEIEKTDEWGRKKLAYPIELPSCPASLSVTSGMTKASCVTW